MDVELFLLMSLLMVLVKNKQEDKLKIGREQRGSVMENQDNLCPFCLLVFLCLELERIFKHHKHI